MLADLVQADWKYMVDVLKATSHPNYLHHDGKPVVGVRGLGLDHHTPVNPAVAAGIIDWFLASVALSCGARPTMPNSRERPCSRSPCPTKWMKAPPC